MRRQAYWRGARGVGKREDSNSLPFFETRASAAA